MCSARTPAYNWQKELQSSVRNLAGLMERLQHLHGVTENDIMSGPWANRMAAALQHEWQLGSHFRFAVTDSYLRRARLDDPRCAILGQVLPDLAELDDPVFELDDPLAEETHMPVPGLTHRYPDRVLWYLSHNCAVYCRFCMRKRKVSKAGSAPDDDEITQALDYIRRHKELHEVILSGGDPLSLSDASLDRILGALKGIDHIVSVRIHSRMPVTLPSRITEELIQVLRRHSPLTLVMHFNHAQELGQDSQQAIEGLRSAGILLLNQSVLLKGINDTVEDLRELFLTLIKHGVKPYYLHQCDEVRGVSHFRVPIERGIELMKSLRGRIPGIALPVYVVDLSGGGGKVPADSSYFIRADAEGYVYRNYEGHTYVLAPSRDQGHHSLWS
jgi:lysine 2,3-aminomutase